MKVLRVFVISITGAFGGALLGAALCGITSFVTYHASQEGSFFGPLREIWKLMALVGAVCGLVPGLAWELCLVPLSAAKLLDP